MESSKKDKKREKSEKKEKKEKEEKKAKKVEDSEDESESEKEVKKKFKEKIKQDKEKEKKSEKKKKEESDSEGSEEENIKKEKKSKKEPKEEEDKKEEEETGTDKRIFPLAPKKLQKEIFNVLTRAAQLKKIKKGANEATKTLNRGISDLIIIAADAKPLEIILHLPLLCEDKNVPYVFVESQRYIGRSCGVSRPVIAASILKELPPELENEIERIKRSIEELLI